MGLLDKVKGVVGQASDVIKQQKAALDAHNAKLQKDMEDFAYLSTLTPCGDHVKGGAIPELPVEHAVIRCGLDENNTLVVYYREYAAPTKYNLHPMVSFVQGDIAACVIDDYDMIDLGIGCPTLEFTYTVQLRSGETFSMQNKLSLIGNDMMGHDMRKVYDTWKEMAAILSFFGPAMRAHMHNGLIDAYLEALSGEAVFGEGGDFNEAAHKSNLEKIEAQFRKYLS